MNRLALLLCLGLLIPGVALAERYSTEEMRRPQERVTPQEASSRCYGLETELAVALRARDFQSHRRIALWGIAYCQPLVPRDSYLDFYGAAASSSNSLGNPQEALRLSEQCIARAYTSPDCHVERALALRALRRTAESENARRIALGMLNDAIAGTSRPQEPQGLDAARQRERLERYRQQQERLGGY